jgi:hypothetical protein
MALISLLLGLRGRSLQKFESGFEREKYPVYDQPRHVGLACINSNCIVHEPMEAQYVRNKFQIIKGSTAARLRCAYCERDIDRFVVASKKNKWYATEPSMLTRSADLKDVVLFADEAAAQAAGFHSRRAAAEPARRAAGRSKV